MGTGPRERHKHNVIRPLTEQVFIYLLFVQFYRDQHGFTPLHYACSHGHVNMVDYLLNHNARNDIINMGGDSILHMAVAHGKYDVVLRVSILYSVCFVFSTCTLFLCLVIISKCLHC